MNYAPTRAGMEKSVGAETAFRWRVNVRGRVFDERWNEPSAGPLSRESGAQLGSRRGQAFQAKLVDNNNSAFARLGCRTHKPERASGN